MQMTVFIFIYYFITTVTYIRCSIVKYSTKSRDNTLHVNATLVKGTIVNATVVNGTPVNVALVHAALVIESLVKGRLVNSTVVNGTPVNVALDHATLVIESLINATVVRKTIVNGTIANETLANETTANEMLVIATVINATLGNEALVKATLVNATPINLTLFSGTLLNETILNATLLKEPTSNETFANATIINATLGNETLYTATLVNEKAINLTIANATIINETHVNSTLVNATLINTTEEGPKATTKRTCVIPQSEFKDVLVSDCFVDKSLMIKDFLNMESHIARVSAPRRFGKTVNLKMLKAFLQVENGRITSSRTEGCSLFIQHNLNIFTSNKTFFHLHCGKYPVIYVNFKKVTGNSYNDILGAVREVIRDAYLEHVYLGNSTRLDVRDKRLISEYTFCGGTFTHVRKQRLLDGLLSLSHMLYFHFNKKAIVLIDDIDVLVWVLLLGDIHKNFFPYKNLPPSVFFIQQFLRIFLDRNRHIERGLINSCLQQSNLFLRKATSIVHFPFLENHPLVKYYGLTENEVKEKLNYFNILQTHKDVKNYYNGYKVQGSGDNMYNTWSVMNYLETENLDDYWISTAGLHNLSGMFLKREVRRLVSQLLNGQTVTIQISKVLGLGDILTLRDAMTTIGECNFLGAEAFLLLLSDNGYFNPTRTNGNLVSLNIPNNEIYQHLYKQYLRILGYAGLNY